MVERGTCRSSATSETFGSLVAQLRRIEADGYDPDQSVARVVRAGGLGGAKNPAAVLAARLARITAARSGGTRPRARPRYLAGLIPQATGPIPGDMRRSLIELAGLIEKRADALADRAILEQPGWVRSLGPAPSGPARRADWRWQLRTIAAYRERYDVSDSKALGRAPRDQGQRLDHHRAQLAASRAELAATQSLAGQRRPHQQIGVGRYLGR
jgi:hypothetical protein